MWISSALSIVLAAMALVEPASIFSDHAVLLKSKDTPVFGCAKAGERVKVSISGVEAETKAGTDGKWLVRLDLTEIGEGPHVLKMNDFAARDVLIGEVWLCSGQSNMEFSMTTADDVEIERKQTNKYVRCYVTYCGATSQPQYRAKGRWLLHMNENLSAWTAVGYHFAKSLAEGLKRPIGIVNASVGASSIESWIDTERFDTASAGARKALEQEIVAAADYQNYERRCHEARMKWAQENGRSDRPHEYAPDSLTWKSISAKELYDFTRPGGAYWFRRTVKLPKGGAKHRVDYGRFAERIWTFNLATVEVYWNGKRLTERAPDDILDKNSRCYDVPAEATLTENTLVVRAYDCDTSRQLPYTFKLDGKRFDEDGWQVADEFTLPEIGSVKNTPMPERQQLKLKQHIPSTLYNGKIASLLPMGLSGIIWYQGETNASRSKEYHELFPEFIKHWRRLFQKSELPFGWCQLSAWGTKATDANRPSAGNGDWAGIRDAQDKALSLPMTGQAILLDVGEERDIHPRNKRSPGKRLAAWALNEVYGQSDVIYRGPRAVSAKAETGRAIVKFTDAFGGLVAHDLGETYIVRSRENRYGKVWRNSPLAAVEGFSVCGIDGKWYWADEATIVGDEVRVSAKEVVEPKRIRYGWAQNPWANLFNGEGLPASPFEMEVR